MKKLCASLFSIALLLLVAGPSLAFMEYPSLEVTPYVGYLAYDSGMTTYNSNLTYGVRLDLRIMAAFGFQFNYALSAMNEGFPGMHFGNDDYVERVQLSLTRDLTLIRGVFFTGYAGLGSFNRHTAEVYANDFCMQAGIFGRRNIFDYLYIRGDIGWTGAFLKDYDPSAQFGAERTLTNHFEASLSLSFLLDN